MLSALSRSCFRGLTLVGRALAYAYIPAIVVVAVIRAVTGADLAHQWATSPALVDHGALWTLFASALVLDRVQGVQLVTATVLTWILLRRHGPGALWSALLLGHVGSTLAAYAGVGILWDRGPRLAIAQVNPDFGISCVWMTILALLIADAILDHAPFDAAKVWVAMLLLGVAYTAVAILGDSTIANAEHTLAVSAGIGTALWTRRTVPLGLRRAVTRPMQGAYAALGPPREVEG